MATTRPNAYDLHRWRAIEREARALVAALPKCDVCGVAPATRAFGRGGPRHCDAHATAAWSPTPIPAYPRREPLLALLALLDDNTAHDGATKE